MKKYLSYLPWLIVAVMVAWVASSLRTAPESSFHIREFGQLPVLLNGRIQPFDSVARNSLLQIRDKQTAPLKLHFSVFDPAKRGQLMPARQWLLEVIMKPDTADTRKVFRVDNPELVDLLKLPEKDPEKGEDGKHYSFDQIQPQLQELGQQYERISRIEQAQRTPFEKQVVKLQNAVMLYQRLKVTLAPPTADDFAAELAAYQANLPAARAALQAQQAGKTFDQADFQAMASQFTKFKNMADYAYPLVVPPANPAERRDAWESAGTNLMQTVQGGAISPAMLAYAKMFSAYRKDQPVEFNAALRDYQQLLRASFVPETSKGRWEYLFNDFEFFYKAMTIYVLAFLLACVSWFNGSEWLRRSAFYLTILAALLHTAGMAFRMILEGRPPVTNLYSSAVFIGWGAALLGLILERIYRDGLGCAIAGLSGFATLIIAHHLSTGGDTMQMMVAVLDSNFWLATHVVTITIGYCGCFVAGLLGIFYILRGFFTRTLTPEMGRTLGRMVYGIVCFATFFSFIGTVLGGIWADQSWGRFWGWDPKENGALLIVLWCAAILHARWGGLVRERGLMNMAIIGNIITAFSWFGVNMLGVGLHSYGFMDSAFLWLTLFIASQLVFIGLGLLPLKYWRSHHPSAAAEPPSAPPPKVSTAAA
jgi:ABC-type transport system involved in cytochrome c biogenesis permease subunit